MSVMKIAYILITNGLEYDDRIRKEMQSIKTLSEDVEFKVFAFHGDNHSETGILSYGVPYEIVSLKRRGGHKDFISQIKKEYDFYSQIKPKVKDFDLLWVCDHQPFFFPLLSDKTIVWDMHELPGSLIGTGIKKLLFHRMENRCKFLIHANQERLDYLMKLGIIRHREKNLVLRNFPDKNWLDGAETYSAQYLEFQKWLDGSEYIYVQGITSAGRYPWETLSAILTVKKIKAVVVGNVPKDVKERVEKEYPDAADWIFYTGQIIQSETAPFISHCMFSIVFYSGEKANNRLCEPNRMFQCLALGKPVIVGKNEPMRQIIEQYENGIVLESYGGSIQDNVEGIKLMIKDYPKYLDNAYNSRACFSWESQLPILKKAVTPPSSDTDR